VRDGSGGCSRYWPKVGSFRYFTADDRWEWSDEVAHMHGYEPGTVTPTTALVLAHKHPDDKQTVAELLDQVRTHGVAFSSRHRIVDTTGRVHRVIVVGDLFYADDGHPAGTVGFYVDVTEQFDAGMQAWLTEAITAIAERRDVINQAIGILRWRHGVDAKQAFEMLTVRSQHANVKLFEVARRFVAAATAGGVMSQSTGDRLDAVWQTALGDGARGPAHEPTTPASSDL
jgi:PAS domain S-box-containing protein